VIFCCIMPNQRLIRRGLHPIFPKWRKLTAAMIGKR
jgi:hypothetical protein